MILAVYNLQVTLMLSTKFQVNWPFRSGEQAKNRLSRWPLLPSGIARHAVNHACHGADKKVQENIDPKSSEVYCLANQFRRKNAVDGDKLVKNDHQTVGVN